MIFRRIKSHIEKENWFAVFIDFCIVVVGVFIGIQVANWNAARVTAEDAASARLDLIADLQNDRDVYAVRRRFYDEVIDAAVRVNTILDSDLPGSAEAQWQFIYDASNAGSVWPFKPSGQVYNQLLNAGRLGLISEAPVQRQMRDYYQDAALEAGVTFKFDSDYRYRSRSFIDWRLLEYQTNSCGNIIGADPSEMLVESEVYIPPCAGPDMPVRLLETASRLHNSEALHNELRLNLNQLNTLLYFLDYLDDEAATLIAELERP